MKKFPKILLFISCGVMLVSFIVMSCSSESNVMTNDNGLVPSTLRPKASELVSPNGYVLCDSIEELEYAIFGPNSSNTIESIEFVDIKTDKGAIAYVNYFENGFKKNVGLASGNISVGYKGDSVSFSQSSFKRSLYGGLATIYRCTGQGCCYVGGETNLETGQHTFYCKYEGNPNQNSDCSLSVTEEESTKPKLKVIAPTPKN